VSDLRDTDSRPTGWHQLTIGHLVMGLAFLGIVGIWALVQTDTVTGDDIRWLLPIPWVVAGVAGLAATAITGPRRYAVRQTGWVGDQPAPQPADLSDVAVDETAPIIPETNHDEETS
jgi:hypothetical protein